MNVKERILAIALAIIFVLFIHFGLNTFYISPKWDDYCGPNKYMPGEIYSEQNCIAFNGTWTPYPLPEKRAENITVTGWCDLTRECQESFDTVNEQYNRVIFILAGIIGLVTIIAATFLNVESVALGLMGGGVLTIIYGTIRYLGNAEDWLRFAILGIVLIILIGLAYMKLSKK